MPTQVSWELTILVPYAVLVGISGFVHATTGPDFHGKTYRLAVDTSILGLGISAAFFGSPESRATFGRAASEVAAVVLVTEFFIIAIAVHSKGWRKLGGSGAARLGVFLTSVILALNMGLVTYVNRPGSIKSVAIAAICALIAPILVYFLFERVVV